MLLLNYILIQDYIREIVLSELVAYIMEMNKNVYLMIKINRLNCKNMSTENDKIILRVRKESYLNINFFFY